MTLLVAGPERVPRALAGDDGEGRSWTSSHRHVLTPLPPPAAAGDLQAPGAIVVPTSRPAGHPRPGLSLAIELARATGSPLVVLCSGEAGTIAALRDLELRVVSEGALVDALILVLRPDPTRWTGFAADRHSVASAFRADMDASRNGSCRWANDVGRKRNLGLLLARVMQRRTVLFLDDDVWPWEQGPTLDASGLAAAVKGVQDGTYAAVGWTLRSYDDNSVLFRIRAAMDLPQEQFIGGGALLVPVDARTPHFPMIYNEDWLFLIALLRQRRGALGDAGWVHQSPYDGFETARGCREEIGDLLCEALMSVVARGRGVGACSSVPFWADAIRARDVLRRHLTSLVSASGHAEQERMLRVLAAVEGIHEELLADVSGWARRFSAYLSSWSRDLVNWQARMVLADTTAPRALLTSGEFDLTRSVSFAPRARSASAVVAEGVALAR